MSVLDLVRDWWEEKGPEHWDADADPDVQYLRRQKAAAEKAMAADLRGTTDRYDVATTLRHARQAGGRDMTRDKAP